MKKKQLIEMLMNKYHFEIKHEDGSNANYTEKDLQKYLNWIITSFNNAFFNSGILLNNKTDLTLKCVKKTT